MCALKFVALRAGKSYDPRTIDPNCAPGGHTRAAIIFSFAILALGFISSCGYGPGGSVVNPNVVVTITPNAGGIPQGTSLVFNANVTGDSTNKGVTWDLAPTSGAGTLTNISSLSVTYNAPATPPSPNQVALSATSVSYGFNSVTELFSVTVPGLTTTITNKITTINAGGQPVTLNVTVTNDPRNPGPGVNWSIGTATANCTTACGTLSNQMPFSVVYTPPVAIPSVPFNMPVIQANSITDPTEFDRNSFTIQ